MQHEAAEPDTQAAGTVALDFQPPDLSKPLSMSQQPGRMKIRMNHDVDKELLTLLGVIL